MDSKTKKTLLVGIAAAALSYGVYHFMFKKRKQPVEKSSEFLQDIKKLGRIKIDPLT